MDMDMDVDIPDMDRTEPRAVHAIDMTELQPSIRNSTGFANMPHSSLSQFCVDTSEYDISSCIIIQKFFFLLHHEKNPIHKSIEEVGTRLLVD